MSLDPIIRSRGESSFRPGATQLMTSGGRRRSRNAANEMKHLTTPNEAETNHALMFGSSVGLLLIGNVLSSGR